MTNKDFLPVDIFGIFILCISNSILVDLDDIDFIECNKKYSDFVFLHLNSGDLLVCAPQSLKNLIDSGIFEVVYNG